MNLSLIKPDKIIAINGYRGDDKTRVTLVDKVYDNRFCGLDSTRNEYRSYLFSEIQNVQEVK